MNNRNTFPETFLFLLSNKSKLQLRQVNENFKKMLTNSQLPPYKNKVEFVIGISGVFYTNQEFYLTESWRAYHSTIISNNLKPAMLYKLNDKYRLEAEGTIAKFAQNEDISANGRKYSPVLKHTWDNNQVWLLAQIHLGRSFMLLSPLCAQNIKHQNSHTYSAFAKEVAVAIKAGYTVSINEDNYTVLNPSADESKKQISVFDIDMFDYEIQAAVDAVNDTEIEIKSHPMSAACELKKLFSQVENLELDVLESFKDVLDGICSDFLIYLFSNTNKKIAYQTFMESFNIDKPRYAPKINIDHNNLYFNFVDAENKIKMIFMSLERRINDLIEIAIDNEFSDNESMKFT